MLCLRKPGRDRRFREDGQARRIRGLGSAQLRRMAHRHGREGRKRIVPEANRLHLLFLHGSRRFRAPATVSAAFFPRGFDPNISGGRRRGQCTKSMIQTHARTPPTLMESGHHRHGVTEGFLGFYHSVLLPRRNHTSAIIGILAYLLLQSAGARATTCSGNGTLGAAGLLLLGIALDKPSPLGRPLWRGRMRQASVLSPTLAT